MQTFLFLLVVSCLLAGGFAQSASTNITASCGLGSPHKSSLVSTRPASFSCGQTESDVAATGAVRVYGGPNRSSRVYIGTNSKSSSSDPIVIMFRSGIQVWCRTDYETTVDQVTGYGLLFNNLNGTDSGELYAVFSSRGYTQGSGGNDFRRFSQEGRERNYGPLSAGNCKSVHPQGAAKVSIVAKLDSNTGSVLHATYLTGERFFGTTSDFQVTELDHTPATSKLRARLMIKALTANAPLRTDLTRMICNQGGPYEYSIELATDLSTAYSASSPGCY